MTEETHENTPIVVVVQDLAGAPVAVLGGVIFVADTGDPQLNAQIVQLAMHNQLYFPLA